MKKKADGGRTDPWTSSPERRASYRNRTVLEKSPTTGKVAEVRKKMPPQSPAAEAYTRTVAARKLKK